MTRIGESAEALVEDGGGDVAEVMERGVAVEEPRELARAAHDREERRPQQRQRDDRRGEEAPPSIPTTRTTAATEPRPICEARLVAGGFTGAS